MLTARQEERLLDVNPVEALPHRPFDPRRDRPRPPARVAIADPEQTAFFRDREVFRMRTRSELYDDWMRDLIEDARAKVAEDAGMYDWDCHVCKSAVMTYSLDDKCPRCGA